MLRAHTHPPTPILSLARTAQRCVDLKQKSLASLSELKELSVQAAEHSAKAAAAAPDMEGFGASVDSGPDSADSSLGMPAGALTGGQALASLELTMPSLEVHPLPDPQCYRLHYPQCQASASTAAGHASPKLTQMP